MRGRSRLARVHDALEGLVRLREDRGDGCGRGEVTVTGRARARE